MIEELNHVVIFTNDMDKALEFYGEVLEFKVKSKDKNWSEIKIPNSSTFIGLHLTDGKIEKGPKTALTFTVKDIHSAQDWLKSKDVIITREATEIAPSHWVVNFNDFDGNPLSIYSDK